MFSEPSTNIDSLGPVGLVIACATVQLQCITKEFHTRLQHTLNIIFIFIFICIYTYYARVASSCGPELALYRFSSNPVAIIIPSTD